MSWAEYKKIVIDVGDLLKAKLLCKSTAESDIGKTITVAGGGNTYTKTLDSNMEAVFTLTGQCTYTITVINGDTVEYTTTVCLPNGGYEEVEVGCNLNSWYGIRNIINAHLENDYFTVGDEFPITLNTGEEVIYRVAGINHDESHQVIFETKYCLETTRQMNTSNTNAGGWNACAMRSWLNDSYLKSLPDDLQAVISERTFQTSQGSQSTTLQNCTDKIWFPKEYEVFGAVSYAASTEKTSKTAQLPIYATAANRVKTYGKSGGSAYWWLVSPFASTSTHFCVVSTSGATIKYDGGASLAIGVLPCFQIVASN